MLTGKKFNTFVSSRSTLLEVANDLAQLILSVQVILFSTLGSITYGYCACIIATTLGQPSFVSYMGLDTASNSTQLQGAINGLFQAGGFIGTLSCSVSADRLGRKKAIFIASCLCVIGGALQAGSVHVGMFIAARLVTGLGIGMLEADRELRGCAISPFLFSPIYYLISDLMLHRVSCNSGSHLSE